MHDLTLEEMMERQICQSRAYSTSYLVAKVTFAYLCLEIKDMVKRRKLDLCSLASIIDIRISGYWILKGENDNRN